MTDEENAEDRDDDDEARGAHPGCDSGHDRSVSSDL
jgi:hypothetical protein